MFDSPESYKEYSDAEISQILAPTKQVALLLSSKDRIREALVSSIAAHPYSSLSFIKKMYVGFGERIDTIMPSRSLRTALLSFPVILFLIAGGVRYVAGESLPGDFLYSVKQMDERVQKVLARSGIVSAAAESHVIEMRLEEAERMIFQERANSAVNIRFTQDFNNYLVAAQDRIHVIDQVGQSPLIIAKIAAELQGLMRAHQHVIGSLAKNGKTFSDSELFNQNLQKHIQDISALYEEKKQRIRSERDAITRVAVETQLESTLENFSGAQAFFGQHVDLKDQPMIDYFNAQTNLIDDQIKKAKDALQKGAYDEALFSLYQTDQLVQETHILLKARVAFHISLD